ncbi:hypothetical protein G6F24_012796 [Rhizopus arrhizus]|nr:hypothetical protein G6F24_012796 [Rhizopus arrhizus]
MMRCLLRCAIALGLLLPSTSLLAAPATAPRALSGELQGAPWRLDVPASWNGDLVMLAHGYEPVGVPRTTPMTANDSTATLLAAGYAVAQSAYSSQGWPWPMRSPTWSACARTRWTHSSACATPGCSGSRWAARWPSPASSDIRSTTPGAPRCAAPTSVASRSPPTC